MPWLKVSDQAANHPITLRALEMDDADDRTTNELFGFVARCAVSAAAYETDYVISLGVIKQIAGMSRWRPLTETAVECGYFEPLAGDDGRVAAYKLVEEKDLFHMILRDERAWENQRKADNRNTKITVPVRKRDGDGCRWCGKIVRWDNDRKSGRFGTYDHLRPGTAATVDTLVVSCSACNFARRDDAASWNGALRPAPETPYYGEETTKFLAKHGVTVQPADSLPLDVPGDRATTSMHPVETSTPVEPNPATAGRTVPGEDPSSGPRTVDSSEPGTPAPHGNHRPASMIPVETSDPDEPNPASAGRTVPGEDAGSGLISAGVCDLPGIKLMRQISTLPDLDLSGRDGSGRAGSGQDGSPRVSEGSGHSSKTRPPASRNRRGRRRGRKGR